jgi:hypothetical protein
MNLTASPPTTPTSPSNLGGWTTAATGSQSLSRTSAGCTPGSTRKSASGLTQPKPVRSPDHGETPLSDAEKLHAIKHGIATGDVDDLDDFPPRRRYLTAGTWGIKTPGLRRAHPFEGLMA